MSIFKKLWFKIFGVKLTKEQKTEIKAIKRNAYFEEVKILQKERGKGVWSCWDCDNRAMQEEDNRAIACGNHGSCFA